MIIWELLMISFFLLSSMEGFFFSHSQYKNTLCKRSLLFTRNKTRKVLHDYFFPGFVSLPYQKRKIVVTLYTRQKVFCHPKKTLKFLLPADLIFPSHLLKIFLQLLPIVVQDFPELFSLLGFGNEYLIPLLALSFPWNKPILLFLLSSFALLILHLVLFFHFCVFIFSFKF